MLEMRGFSMLHVIHDLTSPQVHSLPLDLLLNLIKYTNGISIHSFSKLGKAPHFWKSYNRFSIVLIYRLLHRVVEDLVKAIQLPKIQRISSLRIKSIFFTTDKNSWKHSNWNISLIVTTTHQNYSRSRFCRQRDTEKRDKEWIKDGIRRQRTGRDKTRH